jgi:ubiquinone/menaquinone biosynthesis C-methylase UbiE
MSIDLLFVLGKCIRLIFNHSWIKGVFIVKDHFGIVAPFYDFFLGRRFPRDLARLLKLPAEGLLLDAGGGTGRVSVHFRLLAQRIVVNDISYPMLFQAKRKGDLFPVQSYVERLPFGDNVFDRIIVVDAFHHFDDQEQAISNLIRVLKPGGRMVIEEPDINLFVIKIIAIMEKILKMQSTFLSSLKISRLICENGLIPRIERTKNFRTRIVVDK